MEAILTVNTVSAPLAAGQSAGKFKITICTSDGANIQTQLFDAPEPGVNPDGSANNTPPLSVCFQDVLPGDWIVTATRVDQNGADIAAAATRTFNVAETEAGTTQVPGTITFTLQ
jgi:hypothetical protein